MNILTDYHPKIPLRIFTADGHLLAEYGEERRSFVPIAEFPAIMKNAVLAAEDERFYEHPGVDSIGILRAALANLTSGGKAQGASTITMQVARNFFLTREKSFSRKFYEILLSIKIERNLTKDQILEIYLNQIYLGQRSYGFATAARTYFDKSVKDLSIGEAAMLAGLPKAPSAYNPVVNPKRAALRQAYVLRRMRELGFITEAEFLDATQNSVKTVTARRNPNRISVHGEYVAEMARRIAVEQFKDAAYEMGIRITTTITSEDQEAAYEALRKGVLDYDRRHGYRGPESFADMKEIRSDQDEALDDILAEVADHDDLLAALVLKVEPKKVTVYRRGTTIAIEGSGLRFAAPMLSNARRRASGSVAGDRAHPRYRQGLGNSPATRSAGRAGGDRSAHRRDQGAGRRIRLRPQQVQPCHPGLAPAGLELQALHLFRRAGEGLQSGELGRRFAAELFGRRHRQPGLGAQELRRALRGSDDHPQCAGPLQEHGLHPPARIHRPRVRAGLCDALRFRARAPPALPHHGAGAGSATVWEMASAYSVFANGGYRVEPYIVKEMVDGNGRVLARVDPPVASESAARVIDPATPFSWTRCCAT